MAKESYIEHSSYSCRMQFTYVASVILELTLLQSFTSLNISFSAIAEFMKDVFVKQLKKFMKLGWSQ